MKEQERSTANAGTTNTPQIQKNCLYCCAILLSHPPCTAVLDLNCPLPITITLKQEAFARRLMEKNDMWGARTEPMPFRVEGDKLQSFDVVEDTETSFDYAMCLGDLARYSPTNPGLSFAVHELARFMQRPGP